MRRCSTSGDEPILCRTYGAQTFGIVSSPFRVGLSCVAPTALATMADRERRFRGSAAADRGFSVAPSRLQGQDEKKNETKNECFARRGDDSPNPPGPGICSGVPSSGPRRHGRASRSSSRATPCGTGARNRENRKMRRCRTREPVSGALREWKPAPLSRKAPDQKAGRPLHNHARALLLSRPPRFVGGAFCLRKLIVYLTRVLSFNGGVHDSDGRNASFQSITSEPECGYSCGLARKPLRTGFIQIYPATASALSPGLRM